VFHWSVKDDALVRYAAHVAAVTSTASDSGGAIIMRPPSLNVSTTGAVPSEESGGGAVALRLPCTGDAGGKVDFVLQVRGWASFWPFSCMNRPLFFSSLIS